MFRWTQTSDEEWTCSSKQTTDNKRCSWICCTGEVFRWDIIQSVQSRTAFESCIVFPITAFVAVQYANNNKCDGKTGNEVNACVDALNNRPQWEKIHAGCPTLTLEMPQKCHINTWWNYGWTYLNILLMHNPLGTSHSCSWSLLWSRSLYEKTF